MRTFREKSRRVVEGLGGNVLGQADVGRSGVGGIEHHRQCLRQALDDLGRMGDPVPVAGHGAKDIRDRDRGIAEDLDLLQHRIDEAMLEGVSRDQEDGRRLAWATAAAVTMLVDPGPIEDVATMI